MKGIQNNSLNTPLSPVVFLHHIPQVSSVSLLNLSPTLPTFPGLPGRTVLFSQYFPLSKYFIMCIGLECSLNPFPLLLMYFCSLFLVVYHKRPKISFVKHRREILECWESDKIKLNFSLLHWEREKIVNIYTWIIFTPLHTTTWKFSQFFIIDRWIINFSCFSLQFIEQIFPQELETKTLGNNS